MQSGVFPSIGQEAQYEALEQDCPGCKGPGCERCKGSGKVPRIWRTSRLTMAVQARLWEWVQPRLPDYYAPLERTIDKMSPEAARVCTSDAAEKMAKMNNIFCPEAQDVLRSLEGTVVEFMELLREHHPDITLQMAGDILQDRGKKQLQAMADDYNARNHPEVPATSDDMRRLMGASEEDLLKWHAAKIKQKAEGEWPEGPKDPAPAV